MYRPDNWECPYKPDGENEEWYGDIGARDQSIYEAGADAMLVALRSLPENRKLRRIKQACPELQLQPDAGGYGWLIYIPDELKS